jgi:CheY-like chemotaxis protein
MSSEQRAKRTGPADISTPDVRGRLNLIAHDFNNLLTVVNGYSDLLLKQLPDGDIREQVMEIRAAGGQAAELNEELLSIVRPPTDAGLPTPLAMTRPAPQAAAKDDRESRPAPRVLVVDDEEAVRKLLAGVLASAGYQVVAASDGHQAQKVLDSTPVDLVVMDLVMPNREGIETITGMHQARPDLKIIAISGYGGTFLNVATRLGACAALAKPISPDQLLRAVEDALAHTA